MARIILDVFTLCFLYTPAFLGNGGFKVADVIKYGIAKHQCEKEGKDYVLLEKLRRQ